MATGKLVGTDTSLGDVDYAAEVAIWTKFTADYSGTVSEIKIISAGNCHVRIALYADNSGVPGARLAKNDTSIAISAGVNTIALEATCSVVQGIVYWLAYIADTVQMVKAQSTDGAGRYYKYYTDQYSTFTWPDPAPATSSQPNFNTSIAGWGILVLSPLSISQAVSYGLPKLLFILKPSGLAEPLAYGMPVVATSAKIIYPTGIAEVLDVSAPVLYYPQTISPPGIDQPISIGILFVGIFGILKPQGIAEIAAYGGPTILKYVWHVILDSQYATETPGVNRAYVIGRDQYGNPVYGFAEDSTELDLVGDRLDFQQELAIPTTVQAESMASATLFKMRLSKARGVILVPPNCGQELFDVVQISDSGANQSAIKFRIAGIRLDYYPRTSKFQHTLYLVNP